MYSPCMREDHVLRIEFAKQEYDPQGPLGCCEVAVRNTAGTTTEAECRQFTYGVGVWSLPACGARSSGLNSVAQNIRPCCVGLAGRCEMLSHEHCTIIHGTFHQHDYEHCRQINCLEDVCKMEIGVKANSEAPFYSWHPNQWWRFFLPVFYHNGIIHLLLVEIAQWIVLRPIEGIAGSVRVAIIYFTCVFAGNL
ncbi:inactive rhomboid protein 2-like, partial [Anneissia japonica]|uniref:inactive rhomboid protein 2-like n=1 Tax=Anneissia japonica TaxID=1529436 RepID=UPI001425A916